MVVSGRQSGQQRVLADLPRLLGQAAQNVGTVFILREVDGLESREICATLNISESNLWVMLHRARMALRRCMEMNWFGKEGRPE